jgi:hypothetical protein
LFIGSKADEHGILSGDAGFLRVDHVGLGNADGADQLLWLLGNRTAVEPGSTPIMP